MKHPAGYAPPRRLASPKKQVQLNLRRRPTPEPEDDLVGETTSTFWKWVIVVALCHVVAFAILFWIYNATPAVKPPEQFMSLLPPGDVVKGTAGTQAAPKVGASTPAPSVPHHVHVKPPEPTPPEPPTPTAVKPPPPPPKLIQSKPIIPSDTPALVPDKPVEAKPTPPKPKVKVDLTLTDGPAVDKPVTKPKPHVKKPSPPAQADDANAPERPTASNPDSTGLSKEQIAAKLGQKLQAAGTEHATKIGASGAANSQPNSFADFYAALRDQVMSQWTSPNLSDTTAVNPIVQIHVEKDGRVPAEQVQLIQSSGNSSYDNSALAAAKNLGYLHQPLPDGCPPDIPITFKLTR